jgi:uncharacterized protein (DUF302 family)
MVPATSGLIGVKPSKERPMPADLIVTTSADSVADTLDRIEAAVLEKGLTVFARIDHAGAAREAGLDMQEEQVLVFGNPKAGTMLMKESPEIGIELPLKIVAWADDAGSTRVAYTDPAATAARFGITNGKGIIETVSGLMKALTA